MQEPLIWLGAMNYTQATKGGIWTIGNAPYDSDPNYPGKNNGSFLVKSWVADPKRYGGTYTPKNRAQEGMWEYVRVLTGALECAVQNADGKKNYFPIRYPDEGVELEPNIERLWRLPDRYIHATGITICRRMTHHPIKAGCGQNYEYFCWDADSAMNIDRLKTSINLKEWNLQYIEVFQGSIGVYVERTESTIIALNPGDHVFLSNNAGTGTRTQWLPEPHSYGIVIYF